MCYCLTTGLSGQVRNAYDAAERTTRGSTPRQLHQIIYQEVRMFLYQPLRR
jgi:hypothetical protein